MVQIFVYLILQVTTVQKEGEIGFYEAIVGLIKSFIS